MADEDNDRGQTAYGLVRDFLIDVIGSLAGVLFIIAVCALVITSGTCFLDVFGYGMKADSTNASTAQSAMMPEQNRVTLEPNKVTLEQNKETGTQEKDSIKREPTFGVLLRSSVDAFHIIIFFIVAYVIGGIFNRLDPKRPDRESIKHALKSLTKDNLKKFAVQDDISENRSFLWNLKIYCLGVLDRNWIFRRAKGHLDRVTIAKITTSSGAHFPYSHIRKYLESRMLSHLVAITPWEGPVCVSDDHSNAITNDGKQNSSCSKMFINILKNRILWVAPRKSSEIVRIEAHVRMMSAIWYAARTVHFIFWVSALPVAAAFFWLCRFKPPAGIDQFYHDLFVYLAVSSFAFVSASWLKKKVESRFHYQRVREIVYVLETAYWLDLEQQKKDPGKTPRIFEGLPTPTA